jgi:hypothetical protein
MILVRSLFAAALILCSLGGLSGCVQVDGIWYFVFDIEPLAECSESVAHNYIDAAVPGVDPVDSPWTFTESHDSSPSSGFGQIVNLEDGTAVLILDQQTYPGERISGDWVFSWQEFDEVASSETHESGYTYTGDESSSATTTITMSMSGSSATGPIGWSSAQEQNWLETDQWDAAEVGLFDTQIPASNYLEDPNGGLVSNAYDVVDCSGPNCELSVNTTCTTSGSFTATETKYADEDVFDAVDSAGQP